MKDSIWWRLDPSRINDLQQASIERIVKRCKGAHFTNIKIRINGNWEEHEGDWIKHLTPQSRPMATMWRQFTYALGRRVARFKATMRWQRRSPGASGADAFASEPMEANTRRAPEAPSAPL